MIQDVTDAVALMRSYTLRRAVCKCNMFDALVVWLLLSCCNSGVVLTYELLSHVAGVRDDPACTSYGGTDVLVHCAVRFVVAYVRYAGRMAIAFLRATSCTCGTRSVVGNNMGRDGDDAWT
jgi:hypothetical protein